MYEDILELLHSSDPQDRIRALKMIARTEDPSLLTQLALVHKSDHDPEVREMALKAGRYIRSKQKEADFNAIDATVDDARLGLDGPEYEMTDAAASLGELSRKKKKNKPMTPVSAAAEKRAKGLVDRAMNMSMAGKNDLAAAELRKAFHINPNLADDEYTTTLAAEVMGLPKDEAIDELMYNADIDVIDDGTTWQTAIADLVTYGLVIAIIMFVGSLLFFSLSGDVLVQLADIVTQDPSYEPEMVEEIKLLFDYVNNPSIPGLLLVALGMGLVSIISQLIFYGFLHFVSTNFLDGTGTFRKLIHGVTPFYSIITVIYAVIYGVMIFFMMRGMGDMMTAADNTDQYIAVQRSLGNSSNILSIVSIVFGIGVVSYLSKLLGDVYEYGSGKGCLSMVITNIMIFVVSCGCSFLFTVVAGNMFSNMMTGLSSGM